VDVGLFTFRYGHVPADQLAAGGGDCSITELEYREARNSNKECLCFLLDRKAPWPPDFVDDDRTRINRLRAELEQGHTAPRSRTPKTSPPRCTSTPRSALTSERHACLRY
jgi:hypothetical protein